MRYFVHIGYHGTGYSGWQKHAGAITVQQVLEDALSRVLKTTITIVGCGRTDAHVHAAQFFFHFDVTAAWNFDLIFRLNKILPDDIAVFDIIRMDGLPHARFDAVQRSYDYYIHTRKDPFLNNFSSYCDIGIEKKDDMRSAVQMLPLYNDYRAFCTMPARNENTICHITKAALFFSADERRIRFHISANRFLGKMIRIIAGRLIRIGTGELGLADFERCLTQPEIPQEITPAYPQGLYLSKVTYPYLEIEPATAFTSILNAGME